MSLRGVAWRTFLIDTVVLRAMAMVERILTGQQSDRRSEAILIGAGAGMGVDSGLPDFRGDQGFWRAYPPYERMGLNFVSLANPRWFTEDPTLAWGFYGHRMELYRRTTPHPGFAILRAWASRMRRGVALFSPQTSTGISSGRGLPPNKSLKCTAASRACNAPTTAGSGFFREARSRSRSIARRCGQFGGCRRVPDAAPWHGRIS